MSNKKTRNEIKEIEDNAPMPYYCDEREAEKLFEEVRKHYPEASLHKKTGFMPAICLDEFSRFILAMQLIAVSKYCLYYSATKMVYSREIMIESNLIRERIDMESFREEGEE